MGYRCGAGATNPDSMKIIAHEFDYSKTQTIYNENDVKVSSFPVVHAASGAVGYRVDFAGLSFVYSGDTCACWPLVRACEGGVDRLIDECFPPAAVLAAASRPLHRAGNDRAKFRPHIPQSSCPESIKPLRSRAWLVYGIPSFRLRSSPMGPLMSSVRCIKVPLSKPISTVST